MKNLWSEESSTIQKESTKSWKQQDERMFEDGNSLCNGNNFRTLEHQWALLFLLMCWGLVYFWFKKCLCNLERVRNGKYSCELYGIRNFQQCRWNSTRMNMFDVRTPLHVVITRSLARKRYRKEVLDPYVRLFGRAFGFDFLFMDGNDHPYRVNIFYELIENEDTEWMPWPGKSSDLSPIYNLWKNIWRVVTRRNYFPRDINAFKNV